MSNVSGIKFDGSVFLREGKEFVEVLGTQLDGQLDKLPLERFCIRGGWPLNILISRIEPGHEDASRLEALLYISFTETGAACCSGDVFEHQHFEELLLRIDKTDGTGSFPVAS